MSIVAVACYLYFLSANVNVIRCTVIRIELRMLVLLHAHNASPFSPHDIRPIQHEEE